MQTSGQRIVRRLRSSLFSSLLRQEVGFFDQTRTGELINRLSADTVLIGRSITENLSDGLRAVAQASVGVGMMFFVSPQLAMFVLSIVPPLAVVAVIYGRYLRKVSMLTQDSLAAATQDRLSLRTVLVWILWWTGCSRFGLRIRSVLLLSLCWIWSVLLLSLCRIRSVLLLSLCRIRSVLLLSLCRIRINPVLRLLSAAAVGFLTVSSVITMSAPFFLGKVIDVIYSNSAQDLTSSLTPLCALLSGVFLLGAAANGIRVYLMQTSGQRIVRRLRSSLFSSLLRQEVGFFDQTRTGELINRLSADTVLIGRSITENLSDGLRAVAQASVGVGMMVMAAHPARV
ncbi:unnamed protein product [Ranitomeya imitator]|uniref:ABC transmembrane type-1 domain-containing protein n=1 Tax=Ranitomeya imitator TaxID=111125 RepID=A0ABN9LM93_9NEOB|nr:unnamed protein product [Ranitomeya imitator]